MPTYAQLWTCRGFAMLLCKTRVGKAGKRRPLPLAPHYRGHPASPGALSPSPQFTVVTYSLALQFPRCGDLGGVGRGEEVCAEGAYRGTPKDEIGVPTPLRRLPGPLVPPAPHHVSQFLPLWAAAGHSRRGSHSSKFPLGIQSPRVRETDLSGTRNLRFGKPGSSLGFSRQKGFSRLFPRFLIIF